MNIGIDGRILDWKYSGIARYTMAMLGFPFFKGATVFFPQKTNAVLPEGFKKKVINFPLKRREIFEQMVLPVTLAKEKINLFIQPYNFGIPLLYCGKSILMVFDVIPLELENYFTWARFKKWARWNYLANSKIALAKASRIVCDSEAAKSSLLSVFPKIAPKKIEVIYYGYDAPQIPDTFNFAKFKKEKGIRQEYILANAGLEPRKNQETLIEAFAKLSEKITKNMQLVITGYNKMYLDKLKKLCTKLNILDRVIFTDSVSEDEKNALVRAATLSANPSRFEGFGIPILEAGAFGRPILCSDIAAFVEVGGSYPIFFQDGNLESLTSKLNWFFDNRAQEEARAANQAPALLSRFTMEKMRERWERLINNMDVQ